MGALDGIKKVNDAGAAVADAVAKGAEAASDAASNAAGRGTTKHDMVDKPIAPRDGVEVAKDIDDHLAGKDSVRLSKSEAVEVDEYVSNLDENGGKPVRLDRVEKGQVTVRDMKRDGAGPLVVKKQYRSLECRPHVRNEKHVGDPGMRKSWTSAGGATNSTHSSSTTSDSLTVGPVTTEGATTKGQGSSTDRTRGATTSVGLQGERREGDFSLRCRVEHHNQYRHPAMPPGEEYGYEHDGKTTSHEFEVPLGRYRFVRPK